MKNIKPTTLIRTAVSIVAMINTALLMLGKSPLPFESEQVNMFLTLAFDVGTSIWGFWKNNSFTKEAIRADQIMNDAKGRKKARRYRYR